MNDNRSKEFRCKNCREILGRRDGDTMIAPAFEVEFKHRHRIWCSACGTYTTFAVSKVIDKKGETVKM